ncbi:MAG TPA: serine/threonine-protein kinase [Gemmataceae bacterium]|nr:serine/threonine-protein kinase [Gemmataceae bacterium]
MPAPGSSNELLELIRKSGVADASKLNTSAQLPCDGGTLPDDPAQVADRLVCEGVLSYFQAEQLLHGKWKRFTLGKFVVHEKLGESVTGQIFLCEHMRMHRVVAIKVLPSLLAADERSVQRFHHQARVMASVDHPNCVRAYDIDQEDNLHFIVMEYVDGTGLMDIVTRHGPLDPVRAADYIAQAASGLQQFHDANYVHRNVKPGKLLLERSGVVKLSDMGFAICRDDGFDQLTRRTEDGLWGTPHYMSPEHALDSTAVDQRADIYSLGCTMYHLLTGQPPFPEGTVAQQLLWHQNREPSPIWSLRPEVPRRLARVAERMMAKDPENRFQTAAEVSHALVRFRAKNPPPPPNHEMPQHCPRVQVAINRERQERQTR